MNKIVTVREFINNRLLPKTGQVTSYNNYDDGFCEFGWWAGRNNDDNRQRLVINNFYGDNVVTDFATGLMWPQSPNSAGGNNGATITWANALSYANGLSFGGFTDWYLPNIQELLSCVLFDAAISPNLWDSDNPFAGALFWASTTDPVTTTNAFVVNFATGNVSTTVKTGSQRIKVVRHL